GADQADTDGVRTRVFAAARRVAMDPAGATAVAREGLGTLAPTSDERSGRPDRGKRDSPDDHDAGLRCAIGRLALHAGDFDLFDEAVDAPLRRLLTHDAVAHLDGLAAWRDRPGIVARSVDVMENLQLIDTLRHALPRSVLEARALFARLELLDRVDR